jgi:hypothetical protein
MLPVFAIIFFGVMYVKNASVVALVNLSKARECAWTYSNDACENLPPGCEEGSRLNLNTPDTLFRTDKHSGGHEGAPPDPALRQKVDDVTRDATASKGGDSGLTGLLKGAVGELLGLVAEIFDNKKRDLSVAGTIPTGAVLGNRQVTISSGYRISCNVKAKTIIDVFLDFFDAVNPF